MFARNSVSTDERDGTWVLKYLVSPQVRMIVIEVLKGNMLAYIKLHMKQRTFTLNRFRNLILAVAGYVKIIHSFCQISRTIFTFPIREMNQ